MAENLQLPVLARLGRAGRPFARPDRDSDVQAEVDSLLSDIGLAKVRDVHARRHTFVVRICNVFAYRLRVLEAVTADAAKPLVAKCSAARSWRKPVPEPQLCGANTEDDHDDDRDSDDKESPLTPLPPWNTDPHDCATVIRADWPYPKLPQLRFARQP